MALQNWKKAFTNVMHQCYQDSDKLLEAFYHFNEKYHVIDKNQLPKTKNDLKAYILRIENYATVSSYFPDLGSFYMPMSSEFAGSDWLFELLGMRVIIEFAYHKAKELVPGFHPEKNGFPLDIGERTDLWFHLAHNEVISQLNFKKSFDKFKEYSDNYKSLIPLIEKSAATAIKDGSQLKQLTELLNILNGSSRRYKCQSSAGITYLLNREEHFNQLYDLLGAKVMEEVTNVINQAIILEFHYPYGNISNRANRWHAFEISTKKMYKISDKSSFFNWTCGDNYSFESLKGDALKSFLLGQFKEKLQSIPEDKLPQELEKAKNSREFKILQTGQGLTTKVFGFFGLKTSSEKAFKKIIDEIQKPKY